MQTFMPYDDFSKSIKCLDNRRLNKQRVEAKQILDRLIYKNYYRCLNKNCNRLIKTNLIRIRCSCGSKLKISKAWKNHPAVLMWKGYENALAKYINECIIEWKFRGFNCKLNYIHIPKLKIPFWIGDKNFHLSHRSNLLRKDKSYYSKFNWKISDDKPYVWPVRRK